jgi:hypothetical protein
MMKLGMSLWEGKILGEVDVEGHKAEVSDGNCAGTWNFRREKQC